MHSLSDILSSYKNLQSDHTVLSDAPIELLSNKIYITEAVKHNGLVLQYTSDELKADREVVLEAVKQNGLALQFCSPEFRHDAKIVVEAARNNKKAIEYASHEIQEAEAMISALKKMGLSWIFIELIMVILRCSILRKNYFTI